MNALWIAPLVFFLAVILFAVYRNNKHREIDYEVIEVSDIPPGWWIEKHSYTGGNPSPGFYRPAEVVYYLRTHQSRLDVRLQIWDKLKLCEFDEENPLYEEADAQALEEALKCIKQYHQKVEVTSYKLVSPKE